MALSDINSNLFKPLASRNAPFYTRAIEAIYNKVALDALSDECTPKEARELIKNALVADDLALELFEDSPDELVFDEIKDKGDQIYAALRSFGWIVEIDDIGYRRIIYMPLEAMRLCASLLKLQAPRDYINLRSTYVGVNHSLSMVVSSPSIYADMLEKAADDAKNFIDELHSITGGIRELAHDLQNQRRNSEIFSVYFEDLIGDLFKRYDEASAEHHPRAFHRKINQNIAKLLRNDNKEIEVIARQLRRENLGDKHKSPADLEALVADQLHQIREIFERAPQLIDRIAKYRRSVTKRVKEAMIYSASAPVMFGRDIADVLSAIDAKPHASELPATVLGVNYIAPERLYRPAVREPAPESTKVRVSKINYKDLALTHLYNEALERRVRDPIRLIAYIEGAMQESGGSITSDQLPLITVDDLIAYEQTRELINGAPTEGTPFHPLNDMYDVRFIDGVTENEYLISPKISITRKLKAVHHAY